MPILSKKSSCYNLSNSDHQLIESMKNKINIENFVLAKADEGNRVASIFKDDYLSKTYSYITSGYLKIVEIVPTVIHQ